MGSLKANFVMGLLAKYIGTLAVYTVVVGVVVVRHLSRGKCPFFCRRVLLIQRSASLRGQMIFGAMAILVVEFSREGYKIKLQYLRAVKKCQSSLSK